MDSQSIKVFDERAILRRSNMSILTENAAETFDGATAEDVQAVIADTCDGRTGVEREN